MKAVFIDIDGTLLPFGHNAIPESACKAIMQCRQKGNKVYINTGRCRAEVLDSITKLGFDGIICSNAMYIEENGIVLHNEYLEANLVHRVADWLTAEEIGFFFEGQTKICASPLYFPQMKKRVGEEKVQHLEKAFPGIQERRLDYTEIAKINFIPKADSCARARKEFGAKLQINEWSFIGNEAGMGEITLPGADKTNGVRFMLERTGILKEDSFAFGDSDGDLGMVKFCGTGIAMGNATENLKQNADFITDDVCENGLYKAFEHFSLL